MPKDATIAIRSRLPKIATLCNTETYTTFQTFGIDPMVHPRMPKVTKDPGQPQRTHRQQHFGDATIGSIDARGEGMIVPSQRRTVRMFISSPSDVRPERLISARVIRRLAREFEFHFDVVAMMWERQPLVATADFQDLIIPPSQTDIVIVILWSKLGVRLPHPKYVGAISGTSVTGTEYEFEDALASNKKRQIPDLLLYRKTAPPQVTLTSREEVEGQLRQHEMVGDFMRRWTQDAKTGAFSAAYWPFVDGADFERKIEEDLRELLRRRIAGARHQEVPAQRQWHEGPPYRGLEPFELQHELIFFGRTRQRNEVRELLARQIERGVAFVLIVGASGSGKSSFVKAGLLPDLRQAGMVGNVAHVRLAMMKPGLPAGEHTSAKSEPASIEPVTALGVTLLAEGALPELSRAPFDLRLDVLCRLLRNVPQGLLPSLRQALSLAGRAASLTDEGETRLILVIDQLEELFTRQSFSVEDRERYLSAIDTLARSGLVWVIATMRSDFFDRLEQTPVLGKLAAGEATYVLSRPDAADVADIVRQPARVAGLTFEAEQNTGRTVDNEIIGVAVGSDALPLLEYVLFQLWDRRREDGLLTFEAYHSLGGLEGAIGARAEQIYSEQPAEAQAAFPRVLRALVTVTPGANGVVAARYVSLTQFGSDGPEARLISALLDRSARLLVSDRGAIRVAHEALLRHWPRARDQIAADWSDLELWARLEEAASRWRTSSTRDKQSLLLPSGLPLSEGEDILRRRRNELPTEIAEYIHSSSTWAQSQQRRALRQLRIVVGVITVLLVGAVGAGYFAWKGGQQAAAERDRAVIAQSKAQQSQQQASNARDNALLAQSQLIGNNARRLSADVDHDLALALALEGLPLKITAPDRPYDLWAASALLEAAVGFLTNPRALRGHASAVWTIRFSRDGLRVVTASSDGTARIWDAKTSRELVVLRSAEALKSADFSPDGSVVSALSRDGRVRLWQWESAREIAILGGADHRVSNAAFSRNGLLATAADDGAVRLWDGQGRPIRTLKGHSGPIRGLDWSSNGELLATASNDGTARLWDARSGRERAILRGHGAPVRTIRFSPDGKAVVTASWDKTARTWNLDGREIAVFRGHSDLVQTAAFSPSSQVVISASSDRTAKIWAAQDGQEMAALTGHTAALSGAEFDTDGSAVAWSDFDVPRYWQHHSYGAGPKWSPSDLASIHREPIKDTSLSNDGRRASASLDGTARVWGLSTGAGLLQLDAQKMINETFSTVSASFSKDGARVALFSPHVAQVWSAREGRQLATLQGQSSMGIGLRLHGKWFRDAMQFSADGRYLAGVAGGFARVWHAESGRELQALQTRGEEVVATRFDVDGARLGTFSADGSIHLWDTKTGRQLLAIKSDMKHHALRFSKDGSRLLTSGDSTQPPVLHSVETGREIARLAGETLDDGSFSPDGNRLVLGGNDGTVKVFDLKNGGVLLTFKGHHRPIASAKYSPDGKYIVTASEDTVRLWDSATGAEVLMFKGASFVENAMVLSDGHRVLTVGSHVQLWDLRSGRELASLPFFRGASEDGSRLITVTNGAVYVWSATEGYTLLELACAIMVAPLSRARRISFGLDPDPQLPRCGRRALQ